MQTVLFCLLCCNTLDGVLPVAAKTPRRRLGAERISPRIVRAMFDLLLIFGTPLAIGFAAGYAVRAYLSKRHRRLAKEHSLWQVPPKES